MKIITKNFNIVLNENGSVKYAQNRLTGKFTKHALALVEHQIEQNEINKIIVSLSFCILALVACMLMLSGLVSVALTFAFVSVVIGGLGAIHTKLKENSLHDEMFDIQQSILFHFNKTLLA